MDPNPLPPEFETVDPQSEHETDGGDSKIEISESAKLSLPEIPGYQSVRLLGRGGMGMVILAKDLTLERNVAIKLVSHGLSGSQALRDRFDAEVKTLASLHHPHIAQLYSAGEDSDTPYFVMEYVDGTTLDGNAKEPLASTAAASLLETLAEAIEYCHTQGVLHRDLKPSNILMTEEGQPKIADFGLAKALGTDTSSTKTGEVLGTPGYMSPEQAGGIVKNLGASCDVYGLGAILYRCLTGRAPFVAAEPFQAIIMVLSDDPVRPRKLVPNIPTDLETICLKCLEKKPANRYQTAAELKEDLRRYLNGETILARPAGPAKRAIKWARRNLAATVGLVAVLILIGAGIVGLLLHNATLATELNRSKRLADHGSEFAKWITEDHLASLNEIAGTTSSRTKLVNEVNQFLEDSYADMPVDPIYTERLGYSYAQLAANIGGIRKNTIGDLEQAETKYQRALELYDKTLETTTNPQSVLTLKAEAMLELSDLYDKLGKVDSQMELLESVQSLAETLADKSHGRFLQIQVAGRQIESIMAKNEHTQALEMLRKVDGQIEQLETAGKYELELKDERILSAIKKGLCEENLGNVDNARKHFIESVRLSKNAADENPDSVKDKIRLASAQTRLADLYFWEQKYDMAKPIYEESLAISQQLAEKDGDSVDAKVEVAIKLSHIASLYQNMSLLPDAEKSIRKAISMQEELLDNGNKDRTVFEGRIIDLQSLAMIYAMQGNTEDSQKNYDRHFSICKAELEKDAGNVFVLNQMAENRLTQSLMVLGVWANRTDIDPTTVDESPELKTIKDYLEQSSAYFSQIKKSVPLNAKQQSQVEQIQKVKSVVGEIVSQMKAAAQGNVPGNDDPNGKGKEKPDY